MKVVWLVMFCPRGNALAAAVFGEVDEVEQLGMAPMVGAFFLRVPLDTLCVVWYTSFVSGGDDSPTARRRHLMNANLLATRAVELTVENGGATLSMAGESLVGQPGFAVSIFPLREMTVKTLSTEDVEFFIARNHDLLAGGACLGTWKDETTHTFFLDVVAVSPNRAEAEALGRAHGQLAIFDLHALEEIRL
jgi:hypothetical protein